MLKIPQNMLDRDCSLKVQRSASIVWIHRILSVQYDQRGVAHVLDINPVGVIMRS